MDLTDQGWFDAPEAVEPLRRLKAIAERLNTMEQAPFAEVAFVTSQPAMFFQAPREGLHNVTLKMFRNWHLSRMGAQFEQLLLDDLARPDLPAYKLYIMANLFYLSDEQRALIERVVKRNGATVLWIYAPGYLDNQAASLEQMQALTGFQLGMDDRQAELDVLLTDFDHPITRGLPVDFAYGTGTDREQYVQPPRTQYMPQTGVGPAFYVSDPQARVLGMAKSTGQPGLALIEQDDWRSIYSAAPLLLWPLLRNIARYAGVHVYSEQGDMIWANHSFLAVNSQSAGEHFLKFPRSITLEDAYTGRVLGSGLTSYALPMNLWETGLYYLR
jgi:hypothetical protein